LGGGVADADDADASVHRVLSGTLCALSEVLEGCPGSVGVER
jgi:hypothetical protein